MYDRTSRNQASGAGESDEASTPEGSPAQARLSEEDADLLLEELRELVDEAEPGAGREDEELRDRVERLIASLHDLPVPDAFLDEELEELASWLRILVNEGGHEEQGGPEEIRMLVHEHVAALEDLVSRGFDESLE